VGDFRKLQAWQRAVDLAVLSTKAADTLPPTQRFALGDQWRRAAYSVVLNIAEGASRRGPREFRRYLDIARSSLHEIEAILALVEALAYLEEVQLSPIKVVRDECAKMVYGLLRKMARAGDRSSRST
jgi:four helix bundle protein